MPAFQLTERESDFTKRGMDQNQVNTNLLPPGFTDLLYPEAGQEAAIIAHFMNLCHLWGYERVKPPLIEFEESLLSGPGAAMRNHTFRLMDPVSHRMMGLRSDMTPQIARIAASRLKNENRPLRLSYAGQVLRVGQEQLRPARQIGQMGVELIGSDDLSADGEVLLLAFEALSALGLRGIIIDLHLPRLLPAMLGQIQSDESQNQALLKALDQKDRTEVARLTDQSDLLSLLDCPRSASEAMQFLRKLTLPAEAKKDLVRMGELIEFLQDASPAIRLTLDPTDRRFFDYHKGPAFILYAEGIVGEIGRGGRYLNQQGESATGFSLYLDRFTQIIAPHKGEKRLYISVRVPHRMAQQLRQEGWVVIRDLSATEDAEQAARKMNCTHYWMAGDILAVKTKDEI